MKKILPIFLTIFSVVLLASCNLLFNLKDSDPKPTEEALATMKFAQVLAACSGEEKGTDVTAGFKNSELIQLYLAGSEYIDTTTLDLYYQNGDVRYYYYDPSSFSAKPENILYYEILTGTTVSRHHSSEKNGTTSITVESLNITVNLAPGKLEDGTIVKNGNFFENNAICIVLSSVELTMQSDGSFEIEIVGSSNNYKSLKVTNETKANSTVSSFVFKKEESREVVEEEAKMTFCSVTFDPNNGGAKETKQVIYGTEIAKPYAKPLDSKEKDTFSCWKEGNTEYNFNYYVYNNLKLTAFYIPENDFSKILEAECIYKIATILPTYETLYDEDNQTYSEIFPDNTTADDKKLATILLSSLFKMNNEEKLYVTYDGEDTVYEGNEGTLTVSKVTENCTIGENNSSKTSKYKTVKLKDFSLKLQFGSKFETYSQTFSIDETCASADGTSVITAKFSVGEKTYSLTATSRTLENGKTEVEFDYSGYTFTRTY